MESIDELIETEKECLRRFRAKASEIKAANPGMSSQIAFCKAVEALKQTSNRYQYVRSRLMYAGIPAQPLR